MTNGEVSNACCGIINSPFTQSLDPETTNTANISLSHTETAAFGLIQDDAFGGARVSTTSSYSWILPGEDPSTIFADAGLITHMNFLIPLLPAGWTVLVAGVDTYLFTEGIIAGVTGVQSSVFFSTDADAVAVASVPIPASLPLLISALAGLRIVCRQRIEDQATQS
jgi:hypothetical protein